MNLLLQVSLVFTTPVSKLDSIFLSCSFFYHLYISLYVSYSTCVVMTVLWYSYSLCGCHCLWCGVWILGVWGELASHKRLFNPPPQFSRLGTQCPALMSCHVYLCMCFLWMFWDLWIYWWWFLFSIYLSIYIYLWLVCYELNFMRTCALARFLSEFSVLKTTAIEQGRDGGFFSLVL